MSQSGYGLDVHGGPRRVMCNGYRRSSGLGMKLIASSSSEVKNVGAIPPHPMDLHGAVLN
jgi:hypothetical protein